MSSTQTHTSTGLDPRARHWTARLRAKGHERDQALAELHALLLRAARFEIARRRSMLSGLEGADRDDLAQQSADDALVAVLGKLDDFRGESSFTTWAYKFALYEAAVKVRRLAWRGREIHLEAQVWPLIADQRPGPDGDVQAYELLGRLGQAIESELSPRQREVLVAVVLNEVPIDVLAQRLGSTRGALYKTLHDARRKLRAALARQDLEETGARGEAS